MPIDFEFTSWDNGYTLVSFFHPKTEPKHRLQLTMKNKPPYQTLPQLSVVLLALGFFVATSTSPLTPTVFADDKREGGPQAEGDAGGAKPEGKRDGEGKKEGPRDEGGRQAEGDKAARANLKNTKEGKVFDAYDKNDDGFVTDKEMESMREGKLNSRGRREIRKAIDRADRSQDEKLDINEFIWWYKIGRTDERAKNREK